jgi:hypothetical protein
MDKINWMTKSDVIVNQRIDNGPYANATILSIYKNGWCKAKWDNGKTFSVRVHWLTDTKQNTKAPIKQR